MESGETGGSGTYVLLGSVTLISKQNTKKSRQNSCTGSLTSPHLHKGKNKGKRERLQIVFFEQPGTVIVDFKFTMAQYGKAAYWDERYTK